MPVGGGPFVVPLPRRAGRPCEAQSRAAAGGAAPGDAMTEPKIYLSGGESDYLSRWKRIIHIDRRLRSGESPGKRQLAAECGVTPKTIQRDLDALRHELGAPIAYCPVRRGYHYTDARFAIPAASLGERDLFALMVAENAVAQYEGTPLAGYLGAAFSKILALLDGEVRAPHELARRAIHFGGLPPPVIDPAVWTELVKAIDGRTVLEIGYRKPGEEQAVTRTIHPYQLLVRERDWFLVAHLPATGSELLYYLPRIVSLRVLDEEFLPRAGFESEEFHRAGFNAMQGPGAPVEVRLRFRPEASHLVDERPWSAEQSLERQADGSVVLGFRSAALFEIERQVLRYGGRVEVLAPAELRASLARTAAALAAAHR